MFNKSLHSPVSLTEICHGILAGVPGGEKIKEGLALYFWPKVIGKELAAKTRAVRIKDGTLWVVSPDPVLVQNLTFYKKQIIKKYVKVMGLMVVRSVRIITGEIPEENSREKEYGIIKNDYYDISPPEESNLIKDPDLYKAFTSFYRTHCSLRKNRLNLG